jgi:benzoyl-CoA reductase subunit C
MDVPLITGAEALEISIAGQVMDVKEHNDLLRQLLKALPDRKLGREPGVRLMLAGSVNDNVGFVELVEQCGATCVIEENCCSTKHFWDEVGPGENVLEAIASRYLNRWPCPSFDWKATGEKRGRWQRLWALTQEYRVQGVILYVQKFCGPHGADLPTIKALFASHNIPVLDLELDVTTPVGQFRTRIEAFLETFALELV